MKTFEEEVEEFEEKFKKEHPFYFRFDNFWYSIFGENSSLSGGWTPHQIFENPFAIARDFLYDVKWFFQRCFFGFDDRAIRDVGYFMGNYIPKILGKVKGSKYGIPISFYSENAISESGDVSQKDDELAAKNYDDTIALIKWGFEELEVLRKIPVYGENGIGIEEFRRREKDAKEAAGLLIKYYWEIGD